MHAKELPPDHLVSALRVMIPSRKVDGTIGQRWLTWNPQYYWYIQTFYKLCLNLTKVSILLLYLRIFTQKWFRICCYVLISLVVTYGLVSLFYSSVFQCHPIAKAYHKDLPGHCIDVIKTWKANAGFSIASDVMILVLPMPLIKSLHMSIKHKLGLALLFGLGSLWVTDGHSKLISILLVQVFSWLAVYERRIWMRPSIPTSHVGFSAFPL